MIICSKKKIIIIDNNLGVYMATKFKDNFRQIDYVCVYIYIYIVLIELQDSSKYFYFYKFIIIIIKVINYKILETISAWTQQKDML